MRALSTHDPDIAFGIHPDHQWTGAYAASSPSALYAASENHLTTEWMHGISLSVMQGPIGRVTADALEVIKRSTGHLAKMLI